MTKSAGCSSLSMLADQLRRPEAEEWKHDSKILVDSEASPVSQVRVRVLKVGEMASK